MRSEPPSTASRADGRTRAGTGLAAPEGARVLRSTPGRGVWRERRGGRVVVVKALLRRGPLGARRARRRAEREQRTAAALRAAGLAVPEPLGVERRGAAWCSVWGAVRAARTLEAWLAHPAARAPVRPARLARDLGRLLAALERTGLDQRDWHPGNLLLDRAGRFHALDFHLARLRRPPRPGGRARWAERGAARLAGAVLDRAGPALVALGHRAWWRERAGERPAPGATEAFLDRARRSRARVVERHLDRWERPSGRIEERGGLLCARGRADAAQGAATHFAGELARLAPDRVRDLEFGGRRLVAVGTAPRAGRRLWLEAARLEEHRLPGLRPLARPARAPRWLLFEAPTGPVPTLEAALARVDERGLAWWPAAPPRPDRWPLPAARFKE